MKLKQITRKTDTPIMLLTKEMIQKIAEEADLPPGWYEGPWFNDAGELKTGLPPCLFVFVGLVIDANAYLTTAMEVPPKYEVAARKKKRDAKP